MVSGKALTSLSNASVQAARVPTSTKTISEPDVYLGTPSAARVLFPSARSSAAQRLDATLPFPGKAGSPPVEAVVGS